MRIHIASDHAGFDLKTAVAEHLREVGHEVIDHGAHTYDPDDDYPSFCVSCGEPSSTTPAVSALSWGQRQRRADRRQ